VDAANDGNRQSQIICEKMESPKKKMTKKITNPT
jgi:hypothetical protein